MLWKALAVARKDLAVFRKKRAVVYGAIAAPLMISIAFPLLLRYLINQRNMSAMPLPQLMDAFSFFFVILAASLPIAQASYSILGEKVVRSLEPLLATPTSDGEILLGKVIASTAWSLMGFVIGGPLFIVLMDAVTSPVLGYAYFPNLWIALILLVCVPSAVLYSTAYNVIVSLRVTDVRAANSIGALGIIPLGAIYVSIEIGVLTLDEPTLWAMAAGFVVAAVGLLLLCRAVFQREEILTRWS